MARDLWRHHPGGGSCPVTTTNLLWKSKRSFEKVYYKVWLTLLQSATALFITKCDGGVLQSATAILLQSVIEVITKCDRYYKVWLRLLQSAAGITKCDGLPTSSFVPFSSNWHWQTFSECLLKIFTRFIFVSNLWSLLCEAPAKQGHNHCGSNIVSYDVAHSWQNATTLDVVTLGEFNHGLANLTIVNEVVKERHFATSYSKLKCCLLLWQRRQYERKLNFS